MHGYALLIRYSELVGCTVCSFRFRVSHHARSDSEMTLEIADWMHVTDK